MHDIDNIDSDVIHQIVVEEERMSNPYSSTEDLVSKLHDIRPHLVHVARNEEFTTYMETAKETGVFTAHQPYVLGTLGLYEAELGNPLLPAIVVQARDPPMVGEKYFNMVAEASGNPDQIPDSKEERRDLWEQEVRDLREFCEE